WPWLEPLPTLILPVGYGNPACDLAFFRTLNRKTGISGHQRLPFYSGAKRRPLDLKTQEGPPSPSMGYAEVLD
ncbi:MAG: hypothetical protein ACYCOU_27060, partial [Sulfobacillus sp.]